MKLSILVVNINNLWHTQNLVDDLLQQTAPFFLTVIDQDSTEEGTAEFMRSLSKYEVLVIQNTYNVPLNYL